jgi:hypothetical protein
MSAVVVLWAPAAAGARLPAGTGAFNAGIEAYRAGDYDWALQSFLQAQLLGMSSEQLRFNLGLTYYKLEEYLEARRAFEALLGSRDFAAVSEYHLGLVAAQTGESAEAAEHFWKVRKMNVPPELRQMAAVALERLGVPVGAPRWSALANVAAGYDTNRTQSSETERLDGVDPEAEFADVSGLFRYFPQIVKESELRASAYLRDYHPDHAFDQGSGQLSLRKNWTTRRWQWGLAAEAEAALLGDDLFQSAMTLNLETTWSTGSSSISLRYRPTRVQGGDKYAYVDGSMQRMELAYGYGRGQTRIRIAYEGEINDRRDLESGVEFFSQSPVRHGASLRFAHPLTQRLSLDWNARFRYSRYRDDNRLFEFFEYVQDRRIDKQGQFGLTIQYRLSPDWRMRMDYRYTDNASNFVRYDYDRQTMVLGLEWVPD